MNALPDPLHPALIHFPIVLILLGTAVAVAAVFWRKTHVPHLAATLLVLGAVGAWIAVATGKSDGGLLIGGSEAQEALLNAHQNWAERTLNVSLVAAVVAIGALGGRRWPRVARVLAVVAALAAGFASYAVFETGHRGGALVFHHGAGVTLDTAQTLTAGSEPQTTHAVPAGGDLSPRR